MATGELAHSSKVAVIRPHIVRNYCLLIRIINMPIAIATITTPIRVKSKKSAVISWTSGAPCTLPKLHVRELYRRLA